VGRNSAFPDPYHDHMTAIWDFNGLYLNDRNTRLNTSFYELFDPGAFRRRIAEFQGNHLCRDAGRLAIFIALFTDSKEDVSTRCVGE